MPKLELSIPPLILTAISGLAMCLLHFFLPFLNFHTKLSLELAAALVMLAGLIVMVCAALHFRLHKTSLDPRQPSKASALVISGLFRYSRNPMYLGMLIFLAGLALLSRNLLSFTILPLLVSYLTEFQIKPEERTMLHVFGNDYLDYMMRVRRWL